MGAALALAERGRGRTTPNPNVGCVIVKSDRVVGRGWTQAGGRPHAEAMALAEAAERARGATIYTTLEPCAHDSDRGPACSDLLVSAGVAQVVAAAQDPDLRTDGRGFERLRNAGIGVLVGIEEAQAMRSFAGFASRRRLGRPNITLKLASSLDGRIALANGHSRWITGDAARAHTHLERSRHDGILVGRGTWDADAPGLDVRLEGLEERSPARIVISRKPLEVRGVRRIGTVSEVANVPVDHLLVEGGAGVAASFLGADLVDRLLLYRAPILIGDGVASIGGMGLSDLSAAHGRWSLVDARMLGSDRLEVYERRR